MDEQTVRLKEEIYRQYKNLRQFSIATGIPYSTLKSALTTGIGGMAVETAVDICQALNIDVNQILGKKKNTPEAEAAEVSEEDQKIAILLKGLTEDNKHKAREYLDFLKSKQNQ